MDRIFEAYNGTGGFKPEFMRKTRERLHWTCSQVWGRKALDVGCSQGIGPILLGRMGIDVLGVDVNPEAIAFAKRELEKEPDGVRRKVRFVCEDFVQFKNDEWAQVDAIVMGEVLEHLVRPADFIGRAFQLLKPAGRLVVTVPFGINDDPDHRQTFYLTSVYSFLFPYFEITSVKFFGAWIGFIGKRREAKTSDPVVIPTWLFAQAEDAFNKLERPLVDMRTKAKDYARQIEEEQARSGDLSGQVSALQAKIAALETVSRRSDVVVVEDQVQELKTSLAVERQTNAGHQEQIALLKAALQLASQQKPDAANETRLLEYSQEVKDLRASLDSKSAELVERAERCGRLAAECESSRARVAELEAERDALRKSLEQETEQHKREHTAVCERLAETEAELAAVRGRLAETEAGLAEKEKDLVEAARKLSAEEEARQEAQAGADDLGKRFASQVKSQAARIEELEAELARRRTWTEQHKRESKDVRMRLFSVQNELAEKTRALTAAESRYEAESKAHREALAKIDELGRQLETNGSQNAVQSEQAAVQAARIKELEETLAGERGWEEQHKRECAVVQDRLAAAEKELAAKSKALVEAETKSEAEEKLHKKFSSEAYNLGKQVAAQAARIKELEETLADERGWEEQHKRECAAVQDRLAALEKDLAAKSKALVEAETKSANEEKLHRRFSAEAYSLGKEVKVQAERVRSLEAELAAERSWTEQHKQEVERFLRKDDDAGRRIEELTTEINLLRQKCHAEEQAHRKFSEQAWNAQKRVDGLEKSLALCEAKLKDEMAWSQQHRREVEMFAAMKEKGIVAATADVLALPTEILDLRERLRKTTRAYEKLSKAKLGRLTLAYWRFKDGRKKK